ncbi:vesicular-fusion protein Sec18p [Trichomonascus vanleenenianus]|uniref:AAA family ATPase SEC18 n=1 Tax=Trichomonascus vanleenenianus TaxID=2268995 RepID=UPI003EC9594E
MAPPRYSSPAAPGGNMFKVINCPDKYLAISNLLAVPRGTFQNGQTVIADGRYVFTVQTVDNLPPNMIGASGPQREWARWSLQQDVSVAPYDIFSHGTQAVHLGSVDVEIDFFNKGKAVPTPFEHEVFVNRFKQLFKHQIFQPGQKLALELNAINFRISILRTQVVDIKNLDTEHVQDNKRGILADTTEINFFKAPGSLLNLKAAANRPRTNAILTPNFKFEDMGIGGLDDEFNIIFRRAFASRIYPPGDIEKLGIRHVKGLLLFGPPGTGKTLIARQIGKMLNAVEPKIVNGPEMLSKYVGGSEENIRKLFKDAENEYKEKGDESNLHIIIFDELDAVFKQRGSRGDGTGVGDNVVNQLLAKMDGVEQLNNILVIGMTNRRDLIDSALLRPGRFSVQLEISLPDEKGRRQIFKIHTAKMRNEKKLADDVDINELAAMTRNFSGAEIEGLAQSAASFALNRNVKLDPKKGITFDNKEVIVSRMDFMNALEEVKPAFGASEDELSVYIQGGIIKYASHVDDILNQGDKLITQIKESSSFPIISVLLHGPASSGKTALASSIALSSGFPFIRMISANAMTAMSEAQRIQYISNMFQDAYKSTLNVMVIDGLEDILDWVSIGPRFSNSIMQTLKVFLRQRPPKDRKLLVLCTTSQRSVLESMGMLEAFNKEIYCPNIASVSDLRHVFEEVNFLTPEDRDVSLQEIESKSGSQVLGMGIKEVLFNIEAAQIASESRQEFVHSLIQAIESKPGHRRPALDF